MTALDLQAIEERLERTTPGEWRSMRDGNQYIGDRGLNSRAHLVAASRVDGLERPWNPHAMIAFGWKPEEMEVCRFRDADADFIAAAKPDVRALLEEVKRQAAEIEKLRGALKPFADYAPVIGNKIPDDMTITIGSPLAKRQLTIGECRRARTALSTGGEG